MAFATTTNFDCRPTGNDANGGGWDTASSGTDYSQQNAPQVAFTDLVIGATTTQCTSALNPFTSAYVGNIINIVSGTGFVVQRVQVVSVTGVTATCDKTLGSAASTGGTGNLGGAVATIVAALTLVDGGTQQIVWVQNAVYSQTGTLTVRNEYQTYIGYTAVHGDLLLNPTAPLSSNPLITIAVNSTDLFGFNQASVNNVFLCINFSNTAGTPGDGFTLTSGDSRLWIGHSKVSGFSRGIRGTSLSWAMSAFGCEFTGCVLAGIENTDTNGTCNQNISYCYFHNNASNGASLSTNIFAITITNSVFAYNGGNGLHTFASQYQTFENNAFAYNGVDGLDAEQGAFVGNIFYGNGTGAVSGYGLNLGALTNAIVQNSNNAYGANLTGARNNISPGAGDVTLTVDPFVNSAGGNFALNTTAGGGALCRGAGFPGLFPGGLSTGYADIGPIQSPGSVGSLLVHPGMAGGMRG